AACPNLAVGDEVDLHVRLGRDDGADVAAFDDHAALLDELPLATAHDHAHLGVSSDHGHEAVDAGTADHVRDVSSVDPDSPDLVERDRSLLGQRGQWWTIAERHPAVDGEPG